MKKLFNLAYNLITASEVNKTTRSNTIRRLSAISGLNTPTGLNTPYRVCILPTSASEASLYLNHVNFVNPILYVNSVNLIKNKKAFTRSLAMRHLLSHHLMYPPTSNPVKRLQSASEASASQRL